jgi:hypothetical protein
VFPISGNWINDNGVFIEGIAAHYVSAGIVSIRNGRFGCQ